MKIPAPTMPPITIMVASKRPSWLDSFRRAGLSTLESDCFNGGALRNGEMLFRLRASFGGRVS
jgi:hypothetical protein